MMLSYGSANAEPVFWNAYATAIPCAHSLGGPVSSGSERVDVLVVGSGAAGER